MIHLINQKNKLNNNLIIIKIMILRRKLKMVRKKQIKLKKN